jgi:hypothetical protein
MDVDKADYGGGFSGGADYSDFLNLCLAVALQEAVVVLRNLKTRF